MLKYEIIINTRSTSKDDETNIHIIYVYKKRKKNENRFSDELQITFLI